MNSSVNGGQGGFVVTDTEKATINLQKGSFGTVVENVTTVGPLGVGPLTEGDGTPSDRTQWVVVNRNLVQGTLQVNHGARSIRLNNNVVDVPPSGTGINVMGYVATERGINYNRGTFDVRILYNTVRTSSNFRGEGADGSRIGGIPNGVSGWGQHAMIGNVFTAPIDSMAVVPDNYTILSLGRGGANVGQLIRDIRGNVFDIPTRQGWAAQNRGPLHVANVGGVADTYPTQTQWRQLAG